MLKTETAAARLEAIVEHCTVPYLSDMMTADEGIELPPTICFDREFHAQQSFLHVGMEDRFVMREAI